MSTAPDDGGAEGRLRPTSPEPATAPLPWRRVAALLRPLRGGVLAMCALSVAGVLIGLVPPLALGALINNLAARPTMQAALPAAVIGVSMVLEAASYIGSDGMYARNASRLYRNLRLQMFAGALRGRVARDDTARAGLPSRFISDAETMEWLTLALLDQGLMQIVEFLSALAALAILEPWTVAVVLPALTATWLVARRTQAPTADAGRRRQERLEAMTVSLTRLLEQPSRAEPDAMRQFQAVTERLMGAEVRLGWLRALNFQGSGGLAKLGSMTPVLAAAFLGRHQAGTLMSIYLLAQRVFWSFDALIDLRLDAHSVRGPVARCFELIDAPPVVGRPRTPEAAAA